MLYMFGVIYTWLLSILIVNIHFMVLGLWQSFLQARSYLSALQPFVLALPRTEHAKALLLSGATSVKYLPPPIPPNSDNRKRTRTRVLKIAIRAAAAAPPPRKATVDRIRAACAAKEPPKTIWMRQVQRSRLNGLLGCFWSGSTMMD